MQDFHSHINQRNLFRGSLAILLLGMLLLAPRAAVNIDEIIHYKYAHQVIDWFSSGGKDRTCFHTPETNLKYYGQSVDNLSALINRTFQIEDEYLTRHYIGALLSWLLLLATGLLAKEITGSYTISLLAVFLFALSPRPMGQAFGNLKDIPFALGYATAMLAMVRIFKQMPAPKWKDILLLAFAIAFTNSVRIGGLIFFPYLGLFFLVWLWFNKNKENKLICSATWWGQLILKGFVILIIGYFGSIIFWPYGMENPLVHPIESLRIMEHYKVSIRQIFQGDVFWSTDLPWYYLPLWMLISIPELVWMGVACFIFTIAASSGKFRSFSMGVLLFALLFPFFYVLIVDANLYSGWRQMYFIYAPLVIVAAMGLNGVYHLLRSYLTRNVLLGASLLLASLPIIHTFRTFPTDYVYFNSFTGGNKKAWSQYEYDYYWHGMKEAANWLQEAEDIPAGSTIASNIDLSFYFPKNKNLKWKYVHYYDRNTVEWDYAILGNNYVHPVQLTTNTWQPANGIKTFYHKDHPYIVILKNQNRNSVEGMELYKDKKYNEAIPLLQKALNAEQTDVLVAATLGACYLQKGDKEKLELLLAQGFQLHPYFEPFYLLKAQLEYDKGNFELAQTFCLKVLQINPRYRKIVPLLANCYEKLGETDKAEKFRKKLNIRNNKL